MSESEGGQNYPTYFIDDIVTVVDGDDNVGLLVTPSDSGPFVIAIGSLASLQSLGEYLVGVAHDIK